MDAVYKVLICGDREWKLPYVKIVRRVIRGLVQKHDTRSLLLIEGGAPGVDSMVKTIGHKQNVHVAEIDALWDTRGKSAGPQRNKIMAALEPDEVIGIHVSYAESTGTKNMLKLADALEIPWRLVER